MDSSLDELQMVVGSGALRPEATGSRLFPIGSAGVSLKAFEKRSTEIKGESNLSWRVPARFSGHLVLATLLTGHSDNDKRNRSRKHDVHVGKTGRER